MLLFPNSLELLYLSISMINYLETRWIFISEENYLCFLCCILVPENRTYWMKLKNKLKLKFIVAICFSMIVSFLKNYESDEEYIFH